VEFKEIPEKIYILNEYKTIKTPKPKTDVPLFLKEIVGNIYKNLIYRELKHKAMEKANTLESTTLSKSLAAKLEGFSLQDDFFNMINQLNKTSVDKLKRTYIGNMNLYEFLSRNNITSLTNDIISTRENTLSGSSSLLDLRKEFKIEEIRPEEAYKVYLSNFFWFLRKKIAVPVKKEENK